MVWDVLLDQLWRRGERMIPWRSGRKGDWSLNDQFEEIYLDEYVLEHVFSSPSDGTHISDINYHRKPDGISNKERKDVSHNARKT